jgi:hypothetical protein
LFDLFISLMKAQSKGIQIASGGHLFSNDSLVEPLNGNVDHSTASSSPVKRLTCGLVNLLLPRYLLMISRIKSAYTVETN